MATTALAKRTSKRRKTSAKSSTKPVKRKTSTSGTSPKRRKVTKAKATPKKEPHVKLVLPSEEQEQAAVCRWLDKVGAFYCHPPNGGSRGRIEAARFRRIGVKAGIPDLLVFDVPEGAGFAGVAIEMKKRKGGTGRPAVVTTPQHKAILRLEQAGWETKVAYGAKEAVEFLKELGYGEARLEGHSD